jgi:hypothetical protein
MLTRSNIDDPIDQTFFCRRQNLIDEHLLCKQCMATRTTDSVFSSSSSSFYIRDNIENGIDLFDMSKHSNMLTTNDYYVNDLRHVSIRYDQSSRTYFCFYRRTDHVPTISLTLSYDLNEQKWTIEHEQYRPVFEQFAIELEQYSACRFDEQIRHIIDYFDAYFRMLE